MGCIMYNMSLNSVTINTSRVIKLTSTFELKRMSYNANEVKRMLIFFKFGPMV